MSSDEALDHSEPVAVGQYATEGEAEVAQAKLRAYGIESAITDPVEGGAVPVDGEDGVVLQVRGSDGQNATLILADGQPPDDDSTAP